MENLFLSNARKCVSRKFQIFKLSFCLTILGAFSLSIQAQHQTAQTKFVNVDGYKFAYRTFGQTKGVPLVFLQHFTGTMDNWDPALTDGLAKTRPIVLFDNRGVGSSEGDAPESIKDMADDAYAFIKALDYEQVDLLGFSLGGFIGQQLAADHPALIRKVILAGTAHQGGEITDNTHVIENKQNRTPEEMALYFFFDPSASSQSAGKEFLNRISARQVNRDERTRPATVLAQNKAIVNFAADKDENHTVLRKIQQPVLIVNGIRDIMIHSFNSFVMTNFIKNSKLIIYPDSGHGALFQYYKDFTNQVDTFLNQSI